MNWFSIQSTIKLWLISYQFREYQQNKYGYGGAYQYWVVGSQKSTTPLTVGMAISNTFFGDYQSNRLHIQLRIEGLAKALVRKFKTMDPGTWKVRYHSTFFVQVGHETMYAVIGNHHFFTKTCHRQTYQNY